VDQLGAIMDIGIVERNARQAVSSHLEYFSDIQELVDHKHLQQLKAN
jgi:hypothetical protein